MTAQIIPVDSFDLVVFGGTGDLALRKLLPGLYYRDRDLRLPPESRIIGVARRQIGREAYVQEVETALRRHLPTNDIDDVCVERPPAGATGLCGPRRHRGRWLGGARGHAGRGG